MAPLGETISVTSRTNNFSKPTKLAKDGLQRTVSDISFQLCLKEEIEMNNKSSLPLPPISETVEDAKCECCGMSEECTHEYVERVRAKFLEKWICGLCAEAVKEEMEKNGCKIEEGLNRHMNACTKFNKFGRAYPVLFQADAMREILRKRGKSISPKGVNNYKKGGVGIARSSSCIPAITRDMTDLTISK